MLKMKFKLSVIFFPHVKNGSQLIDFNLLGRGHLQRRVRKSFWLFVVVCEQTWLYCLGKLLTVGQLFGTVNGCNPSVGHLPTDNNYSSLLPSFRFIVKSPTLEHLQCVQNLV